MWHVDAEVVCLFFMAVILIDVYKGNTTTLLRDRIFKTLAVTTLCAIVADIVSSMAMMASETAPGWLIQASLLVYFLLTPLLSVLWQLYAITIAHKPSPKRKKYLLFSALPFLLFAALVLSNPLAEYLFTFSDANEYARGVLFNSVFVMFYGYSVGTLLLTLVNYKKMERTTSIVLMVFPIIAGGGVLLQEFLSGYLVTGTAFTLVLLITYLFLQNRKVTRDTLTGLYNRRAFSTQIEKLTKSGEQGFVLAVAMDDFKLFNQNFGQKNGDLLLGQVAEYLVHISPDKTAYRYGGDIFILLLKKVEESEAHRIAEAVLKKFETPISINKVAHAVSASIGVVGYPCVSEDINDSIISGLDFSVYQAKKRGKGQIAFFNEELVQQFKRKHAIMDAVNHALAKNTFEVYLQPVYSYGEKRFAFAEALLRLKDPVLGNIGPSEFIPLAEESGQIVEITYFVLEKVCAFLQQNQAALKDRVSVSVNFSVIQFMQTDMVARVKEILERYHIPPCSIKIEITESMIADSFDNIKKSMEQLNDYGILFALDDYGQGYSNISYLINLPFAFVKLDKSIIDNVTADQTFVRALISMFKSLDKLIIAEGVEIGEQSALLSEMGCDATQGYYFARPAPMREALGQLAQQREETLI